MKKNRTYHLIDIGGDYSNLMVSDGQRPSKRFNTYCKEYSLKEVQHSALLQDTYDISELEVTYNNICWLCKMGCIMAGHEPVRRVRG